MITDMMPEKRWLPTNEACAYVSISRNLFVKLAVLNNLTVSAPTRNKLYKVSELNSLIEAHIIVSQIPRDEIVMSPKKPKNKRNE